MTNPISQYARLLPAETPVRTPGKVDKNIAAPDGAGSAAMDRPSSVGGTARPGPDVLDLSNITQRTMNEPEFDRAKVDAIKEALKQGQYPLDPRRIAESFVAVERMIRE